MRDTGAFSSSGCFRPENVNVGKNLIRLKSPGLVTLTAPGGKTTSYRNPGCGCNAMPLHCDTCNTPCGRSVSCGCSPSIKLVTPENTTVDFSVTMEHTGNKPQGTHTMPDGTVMTGSTHSSSSRPVKEEKTAGFKNDLAQLPSVTTSAIAVALKSIGNLGDNTDDLATSIKNMTQRIVNVRPALPKESKIWKLLVNCATPLLVSPASMDDILNSQGSKIQYISAMKDNIREINAVFQAHNTT